MSDIELAEAEKNLAVSELNAYLQCFKEVLDGVMAEAKKDVPKYNSTNIGRIAKFIEDSQKSFSLCYSELLSTLPNFTHDD